VQVVAGKGSRRLSRGGNPKRVIFEISRLPSDPVEGIIRE